MREIDPRDLSGGYADTEDMFEPTKEQIEELREALRRGIELGARFLAYPRSESARHDFDVALDMMRAALAAKDEK